MLSILSGQCWLSVEGVAEPVQLATGDCFTFKATVGISAMEYLTRWRMLLAGDRMATSNASISTIAPALGYASESAFQHGLQESDGLFATAIEAWRSAPVFLKTINDKEREDGMKRVQAGVLDVAYVEYGPSDGPPVVLLHGFPMTFTRRMWPLRSCDWPGNA